MWILESDYMSYQQQRSRLVLFSYIVRKQLLHVLVKRITGIMCAKIAKSRLNILKLFTEDCIGPLSGHGAKISDKTDTFLLSYSYLFWGQFLLRHGVYRIG